MKKVFEILTLSLVIVMAISLSNIVAASTLQSRPGVTRYSDYANTHFYKIRQMECLGGTLGLSATVDNIGDETSISNNIDCHMIKNTEWGAVAILSASQYGNLPSDLSSGSSASTTQNATGVYQMCDTNLEYVSAVPNFFPTTLNTITNSKRRYKDIYISNNRMSFTLETAIPGDATFETGGWKGVTLNDITWYEHYSLSGQTNYYYITRNNIFSSRNLLNSAYSRAIIVNGTGI